jgi:hypothetical protein
VGDLLLVALFLGMLLWVGWPVTLWAGCAVALAYGARRASRRTAAGPGARAFAHTLVGIATGLGVVWLTQVLATGFAAFAGGRTLRGAERWLVAAHASLGRLEHPAVFVIVIALALILCRRIPASRLGPIVAAAGTLLFFGPHAEQAGEARWVASRRSEASSDLRALRAAQTRLVATAEIELRIARLSAEERGYLESFLRSCESKRHRPEIIAQKAERLAAHTREPRRLTAEGAMAGDWAAVAACDPWLRSSEAEGSDRSPSFDELDALARVSGAVREREARAQTSVDAFAIAVVEATARRWTDAEWGGAVWDPPSAERIVAADDGPREPWPVATSEQATRSAAAEVEASEIAFELGDGPKGEPDWSDPPGTAASAHTDDVPGQWQ